MEIQYLGAVYHIVLGNYRKDLFLGASSSIIPDYRTAEVSGCP